LTGRNSALGFIKADARTPVCERLNRGGRGFMAITHAHIGAHGPLWIIECDPVDACGDKLPTQQLFALAHDHAIAPRINLHDVERSFMREPQAASLPDREVMYAYVLAQ